VIEMRFFSMKSNALALTWMVLTLSSGHLFAQNSDATARALTDAFRHATAMGSPIPQAERDKAYQAASLILNRLVTFNEDGTAKTTHQLNSERIHLEWSDLRLGQVSRRAVTDADRLNGITNRYAIAITAKSHRRWNSAQNRWTEWQAVGYPLFPTSILLLERNGALEHAMTLHGTFGNGLPAAGSKIEPRANELPSGIQRKR